MKNLQLIIFLVSLLISTGSVWAGFDEAQAAYDRGDYAVAFKEWEPLATQGDSKAQFALGKIYLMGYGVRRDAYKASDWFLKAAEQGHADAQFYLGKMYEKGGYILEAMPWYRKAAEQGHVGAQKMLPTLYPTPYEYQPAW